MAHESSHSSHHHHHHHHSSEPEKKQLKHYLRIVILCLFAAAVLVMIPYIAHKFLPFIKSISFYHKINISSICYLALRVCLMAIPFVLAVPAVFYKEYIEKAAIISKLLSLTSFFFFTGMVADILTYNVLGGYVDDGSDPIMLKLLWNNTGLAGVGFCFIEGVIYLILSKKVKGHKKDIVILFALAFVLGAVMPLAYMMRTGTLGGSGWSVWFSKNIYFFISQGLTLIGLIIAGTSRWLWSSAFLN